MPYISTQDGTRIFCKDMGSGQPILFLHGWPLSADAWDPQPVFFADNGYRAIAHDPRSHRRCDQTWDGNQMDCYADDLAELIEALDLEQIILVGHSTGGGEITHYAGRHGTARVAKMVLVGAVSPLMLRTDANPGGLPIDVSDGIRKSTFENRSQFYNLTPPFYGYNRDHGDDDQIVPIDASDRMSARIVPNATHKVYKGAPHGLAETHRAQLNEDLLTFARG